MKRLLSTEFNPQNLHWLDFTAKNKELEHIDLVNTTAFSRYIFSIIPQGKIGIGGWLENRAIYQRSKHFQGTIEARTIHLGLDLWTKAYTPIYAPVNGKVHSFQNNDNFGDYGPTIILEHEDAQKAKFYTLYGHLSITSLANLEIGQYFDEGDKIAEIGDYPENGDWPPHLHFQVMKTMDGRFGDFPGVCSLADLTHFEKICINPLDLLGIKKE